MVRVGYKVRRSTGSLASTWHVDSASSDAPWIDLDLSDVMSFDRVRLNWGSTDGSGDAIQLSHDASNGTTDFSRVN